MGNKLLVSNLSRPRLKSREIYLHKFLLRKVKFKVKKILSLILACGLICSALFVVTGCSDNKSDSGDSSGTPTKYQEIFDHIKDCDVESSGSSQRILETNFYIKNWIKDNPGVVSESNLVSGSDAGSELSKYIEKFNDDEKAKFGTKCQAIVDAELKLGSTFNRTRSESWGADVQQYSDNNIANFNAFFESLQDALSTANIHILNRKANLMRPHSWTLYSVFLT